MVRTGFTELSAGDNGKKGSAGGGGPICVKHIDDWLNCFISPKKKKKKKKKAKKKTHLYASKRKKKRSTCPIDWRLRLSNISFSGIISANPWATGLSWLRLIVPLHL